MGLGDLREKRWRGGPVVISRPPPCARAAEHFCTGRDGGSEDIKGRSLRRPSPNPTRNRRMDPPQESRCWAGVFGPRRAVPGRAGPRGGRPKESYPGDVVKGHRTAGQRARKRKALAKRSRSPCHRPSLPLDATPSAADPPAPRDGRHRHRQTRKKPEEVEDRTTPRARGETPTRSFGDYKKHLRGQR